MGDYVARTRKPGQMVEKLLAKWRLGSMGCKCKHCDEMLFRGFAIGLLIGMAFVFCMIGIKNFWLP